MSEYEGKYPKDKIGQNIAVGSYVAYGHALGRCAGLRIGKVLAYKFKGYDSHYDFEKQKHVEDKDKPIFWFTVWGIDDDWGWKQPKLQATKGTLQFQGRILVLNPKTVPANYRKLLDPLTIDSKSKMKVEHRSYYAKDGSVVTYTHREMAAPEEE